jgi:hypothetical protein
MIHMTPQSEAAARAHERGASSNLSSGQEEWFYCIMVPIVVVGWVLLFIYVIL